MKSIKYSKMSSICKHLYWIQILFYLYPSKYKTEVCRTKSVGGGSRGNGRGFQILETFGCSRGFQGYLASVYLIFHAFLFFLLGPEGSRGFQIQRVPGTCQAPSMELWGFHETLEPTQIRPWNQDGSFPPKCDLYFSVVDAADVNADRNISGQPATAKSTVSSWFIIL